MVLIACGAAGRATQNLDILRLRNGSPKACSGIPQVCRDICIRFCLAILLRALCLDN